MTYYMLILFDVNMRVSFKIFLRYLSGDEADGLDFGYGQVLLPNLFKNKIYKSSFSQWDDWNKMAEAVGLEPTRTVRSAIFETGSLACSDYLRPASINYTIVTTFSILNYL